MKIKTYPGYAIDASKIASNEHQQPLPYEENWIKVFQKFQSKGTTQLSNKEGVWDDRIGIDRRPQTVRMKKNLPFTEEWNSFDENINPLYKHTHANWHSSASDLKDRQCVQTMTPKTTKIRRSHTVIVKQPTFKNERDFVTTDSSLPSFINQRGDSLFHRSLFLPRKGEHAKLSDNGDWHVNESCFAEDDDVEEEVEKKKKEKESFYRSIHDTPFLAATTTTAVKSYEESRHNIYNRMQCYETTNAFAENLQKHSVENKLLPSKVLLNPLAQNKNIKLNHLDVREAAKQAAAAATEELNDDPSVNGGNVKKGKSEKKNGLSKLFYATISGSKLPKMFQKSLRSRRPELNIERDEIASARNASSSSSASSVSCSKSDGFDTKKYAAAAAASVVQPKNAATTPSDMFVIPRPRLIVPVHTYARKRRTGNLTQSQRNLEESIKARKGEQIKLIFNLKFSLIILSITITFHVRA
jgi:hypothetical protein